MHLSTPPHKIGKCMRAFGSDGWLLSALGQYISSEFREYRSSTRSPEWRGRTLSWNPEPLRWLRGTFSM